MNISRRTILKCAGAIGAASTLPAFASEPAPRLIVFDSRIPESRDFAVGRNAILIDVAHEDKSFWRSLRSVPSGEVAGLTTWSDWVVVRGYLEEQRMRLRSETRVGDTSLFHWRMA